VAAVELSAAAVEDLEALIRTQRCPSVTASMTVGLRCSTRAICSSIVPEALRSGLTWPRNLGTRTDDRLVDSGAFANRSQAVRSGLAALVASRQDRRSIAGTRTP